VVFLRVELEERGRGCGESVGFGLERVFVEIKGKKLKKLLKDLTKSESDRPFSQLIETGKEQVIDY
jgi:hypothetical protein